VREIVSRWLDGDPEVRKQSRILRDDNGVRVEQAEGGQIIALDVRGRSRVSGENRAPEAAPNPAEFIAGTYGDVLARQ
jgi:hypothetical protein